MKNQSPRLLRIFTITIGSLLLFLGGCSGDDGTNGAAGPSGANGLPPASDATELNMVVTDVSINTNPVVSFEVTNQNGSGVTGLTTADLRFTIAKLIPSSPTRWQNYIVTTQTA